MLSSANAMRHRLHELPYLKLRFLRGRRGRASLIALLLTLATAFLLWFSDAFYPARHWLFFRYVGAWACVALFMSSALVGGWGLLAKLLPHPPRLPERLILSLATGVLAFYGLMFLLGIFRLYSRNLFLAVPLVLLGAGGPRAFGDWRRILRRSRGGGVLRIRSWIGLLSALLVTVSLLAIYLQVMLPKNLHADSHWYHLPIAEYYIAAGGIVRFSEGWYLGTYPQLASLLYTWAFLTPGDLFSHVSLCLHMDFALFVVTVAGVAVVAARLLRVRRLPLASAVIFLFPNLFIYDSNVSGNADHILGFWAAPLALALLRMGTELTLREAIVGAMMISAAALTKYQGCYLVVPALLISLAFAIRQRRLMPLLALLGVAGVITSSHWLKNLIFYHDPFYPLLNQYFPSKPFHTDAAKELAAAYWDKRWIAVGSWSTKLMDAAKALVTFSFVPNDFDWHGHRPTFGSLFTLLIPITLLVKAPLRVWLLALGTHLGLAIWYLTSHQDRFLQALLPWMAMSVAAVLALVWRRGVLPRAAATLMVLSQLVLGLDVYFIRTHVMLGDSVVRELSLLLAQGHEGKYEQRFSVLDSTFEKTARALSPDTVLLEHNYQARLGLGVPVISDGPGWQGAIEYLDHDSPQSTAQLMRSFGVNKAFRRGEPGWLSPTEAARELVLLRWLQSYGSHERHIDEAQLTTIVPEPVRADLAQEPTRIAWLDCDERGTRGLYTPRGLAQGHPIERFVAEVQASPSVVRDATALVLNQQCPDHDEWVASLNATFQKGMTAGPLSLWVRTAN